MIGASVEFKLEFENLSSDLLNNVKSAKEVFCSIPIVKGCIVTTLKHHNTTVWKLMIWLFDPKSTTLWSPDHLKINKLIKEIWVGS
jgi:hypothetical protein